MSVFQKLRKISENPDSDREEDFLTEIFAHALKYDLVFKAAFFSKLPKEYRNQEIQSLETQKVYPALGTHYSERRPDIEINLQDAVIIVENKVRSGEGKEQLSDYAKILNLKSDTNKLLVYITVYLDIKKHPLPSGVDFVPLRWQEIGELISPKCGDFAREMKVYLKSEKLMMKNFDYQDLAALNTFFSTAEKINGIFRDDVGPYFVREMKMHSFINNQPKIVGKEYCFNYNYGKKCTISFGIESWLEDEHPRLFIRIGFLRPSNDPKGLSDDVHKMLGGDVENWERLLAGPNWAVVKRKRVLDFMVTDEQNQRSEIVKFFTDNIDKMEALKIKFPEIFGNPTPDTTSIEQQTT